MGWATETYNRIASHLNAEGQPVVRNYRASAIGARQADELIGLIKGVLADDMICQKEVEFLLKWMQANQTALDQWPAKVLYPRIAAALKDGQICPQEETELFDLLQRAVGNEDAVEQGWASGSTNLPLDAPLPIINPLGRTFCFTGQFNSGSREWCHSQVIAVGGLPAKAITKKLDYLVIGDLGSRDWLHSTHGTKILKAVEYRNAGALLRIVSEKHWYSQLVG